MPMVVASTYVAYDVWHGYSGENTSKAAEEHDFLPATKGTPESQKLGKGHQTVSTHHNYGQPVPLDWIPTLCITT